MTPPRLDEGSEREAFEGHYAKIWKERTFKNESVEELAAVLVTMREGDEYNNGQGQKPAFINNLWQGWQARAALSASKQPKVLDDPRLQELFGDAIEGALALGFQNSSPPPDGHWLARFWNIGRAEAASKQEGKAEGEAEEWHAVLSPSRNAGVIFKSERDAKWTATGVLRTGFGVPVIGDAFRDAYDETSKFVIETVSAAPAAKPQGDSNA